MVIKENLFLSSPQLCSDSKAKIIKNYKNASEKNLFSKLYSYKDTMNSIQLTVHQFNFIHVIYHSISEIFIENLPCICTVFDNENA